MQFFHRRRFFFWLIRAYVKRWTKVFLAGLVLGAILFVLLKNNFSSILTTFHLSQPWKIGVVGSYTSDVLPLWIQDYISFGLTKIDKGGNTVPSAAESWEALDNGKTYIFHLRRDLKFQDGGKFTSKDVNYQFKEAKVTPIDPYTVRFDLNEQFAPFPTFVSRPIFKKGLIGLGQFEVEELEQSGSFIKSLTLTDKQKPLKTLLFRFYPTEQAIKTAFTLGEVSQIEVSDAADFNKWNNVTIEKNVDPSSLVVVFYSVKNPLLSSKQVRQALMYALPDSFSGKKRANSPLRMDSWAYREQPDKFKRSIDNARKLLGESKEGTSSSDLSLIITTPPKFQKLAEFIQSAWNDIGIDTKIQSVDKIPPEFQVLLDEINLPPDPDQYYLWHSLQPMNLSQYANPRIDKLLEDGRKTVDQEKRAQIYADFQKYLVDDAPAAFLYYPDVYTIKRK